MKTYLELSRVDVHCKRAILIHTISCKEELCSREILVNVDFSENYSFILQDAIQGYHWNNSQVTIHPYVAYYINSGDSEVHQLSYVIISDCLHHDTISVFFSKNAS